MFWNVDEGIGAYPAPDMRGRGGQGRRDGESVDESVEDNTIETC